MRHYLKWKKRDRQKNSFTSFLAAPKFSKNRSVPNFSYRLGSPIKIGVGSDKLSKELEGVKGLKIKGKGLDSGLLRKKALELHEKKIN